MTDRGVWHSTNLVGVPTGLLASCAFNEHPLRLHLAGVRETNPALFEMLAQASDLAAAAEAFEKYMRAAFEDGANGKRRYRTSYRQLLEGWGYDANGPAGAVLKGWVESRFGLLPAFHRAPLRRVGSAAWVVYVEEKMSNRYHNNSINQQLDLLFEFCQWALARFARGRRHLTLYRGVNDFREHEILMRLDRHHAVLRLNNLVSFSADRDIAGTFGDTILAAEVPVVKLLFFRDLLPSHPLTGEAEHLAIGGDYRVQLDPR
jgi:NAD+--dinitrogen-reductase ADP-D-ribosyltransferase